MYLKIQDCDWLIWAIVTEIGIFRKYYLFIYMNRFCLFINNFCPQFKINFLNKNFAFSLQVFTTNIH